MHDPHALSIFHRELISKLEGHVSRCYTFFERGSIYKDKMMFVSVFILLYWSWYLLKLTCLCQNLDGVVTKFSNAELLISAMKFFKSTHGIEKQGNDQSSQKSQLTQPEWWAPRTKEYPSSPSRCDSFCHKTPGYSSPPGNNCFGLVPKTLNCWVSIQSINFSRNPVLALCLITLE